MTPLLTEFGLGTSLRRHDHTEAACRAVRDALWRNSINVAELFGRPKADMRVAVEIGARAPEAVDRDAVAACFPYGTVTVSVVEGGLDMPRPDGDGAPTVMVVAAITVSLEGV